MSAVIDLKQILNHCIEAIRPVMTVQQVDVQLVAPEQPYPCSLPLDEVLGPVFNLLLKMIYILPKGREIQVSVVERKEPESDEKFLVIELRTYWLTINPNLMFKPDNNRFKVSTDDKRNTLIFIEWPLNATIINDSHNHNPQVHEDKARNSGIDISSADSATILNAENYFNSNFGVIKNYGKSSFVRDKVNGFKSTKDSIFLSDLVKCITTHLADPGLDPERLCRELGYSRAQLHRKIKEVTGLSTSLFIRSMRLQRAAELLSGTEYSIGEISLVVGFKDLSYFSSSFQSEYKLSPSEWKRTQRGMDKGQKI